VRCDRIGGMSEIRLPEPESYILITGYSVPLCTRLQLEISVQSMSRLEIAELTNKTDANVIRDILTQA
jgi:hypothetical protein